MPRGSNSHFPFMLAFRGIAPDASVAERVRSNGYPPFNIERISGPGAARLRVTLAVAGFAVDQIEIVATRDQLVIRGRQKDGSEKLRLHRGIAARQFQRVFLLAEAMQVALATLDRGLLLVELAPPGAIGD